MLKIAKIAIGHALTGFDRLYDYRIPDGYIDQVKPGMRVIVPFGASDKPTEGMVMEIGTAEEAKGRLKDIKALADAKPVLDSNMLQLVKMMKQRYMCTWADAYRLMVPPGTGAKVARYIALTEKAFDPEYDQHPSFEPFLSVLKNADEYTVEEKDLRQSVPTKEFTKLLKKMQEEGLVRIFDEKESTVGHKTVKVIKKAADDATVKDLLDRDGFKNIKYIRFLEVLMQVPHISVQDAKKSFGMSDYMLNRLVKLQLAKFDTVKVTRSPLFDVHVPQDEKKKPNEQQQKAIDGILDLYMKNRYESVLLYGVTGSGKTEVYLQLIEKVIETGRQVIVLVPEISLTPQTVARFKSRFQKGIAVFHSRLSQGERYDQWMAVSEGKIQIVIGARSAVFAPLSNLGMIIVDEEHESSYKSDKNPKYNALEIAAFRCKGANALLLLGSATPSVNTWYKCETGLMKRFELTERATGGGIPDVEITDMRMELASGNLSLYSRTATEALKETFAAGKQALILLNRRGYSQYALCTDCGKAVMCPSCSLTLKYHKSRHRLLCHMCGYTVKMPDECPTCGKKGLILPGIGTQRAEEELKSLFPDVKLLRMDTDTVTRKDSYDQILGDFRDKKAHVLLGTQMIAKGHDFPDVVLSVILSVDSMLYTEGYNATERAFQLLLQASGRSGRGEEKGKVLLQTYNPEHYVVQYAKNHDYKGFYEYEIRMRRLLVYPPFCNLGFITVESEDDALAEGVIRRIRASIDAHYMMEGIGPVLGPVRAPVERVADRYVWRIIIKSAKMNPLIRLMNGIRSDTESNVKSKNIRLYTDINP
jgi:primosomal protein N' (replication factor Y)